jgi:hypothetical protein
MKRSLFLILFALAGALPLAAQTSAFNGFCVNGGKSSVTQGANSSNKLEQIIPSCTVTVYLTGTTTKATIYSDVLNTPLANPFTADNLAAVAPGKWIFWAANGQGYDVVMSGGIAPLTYAAPVTLTDLVVGPGGGGGGITSIIGPNGAAICTSGSCNIGGVGLQLAINGTPASSQTYQNLENGSNVSISDLGSGNIQFNASLSGAFQMYVTAPATGNYVIVYPTACVVSSDQTGTGCDTKSGYMAGYGNYTYNTLTWSFVGAASQIPAGATITHAYPFMISSAASPGNNGIANAATCKPSTWPGGGNVWTQGQGNCGDLGTTPNWATYVMTANQTNGGLGGHPGTLNVPLLGVYVTYTGAATVANNAIQVISPLNYNSSTNSLSLTLPYDYATDTGSVNAYAVNIPAFGAPGPGKRFSFAAAHSNTTTAPTVAVTTSYGTFTCTVVKQGGAVLAASDILSTEVAVVETQPDDTCQLLNPQTGGGGGGTTTNALTMNNGGAGAASGSTFNGSAPITLSYNTLGAAPTASPTFTGTVTMPAPTFNNVTGSTQCLNVNSSGVVSGTGAACGSGGGGTITGSGTANTITKWTGASAIGNSAATDNGTIFAYGGTGGIATTGTTQGALALAVGTGTLATPTPTYYTGIVGPPSGTGAYFIQLPGGTPSGGQVMSCATPSTVNGVSQSVCTWATNGSGVVSGQANGVIPLATGATTIGAQSHLDDGITTASTITSTEPITITGSNHALTMGEGTAVSGSSGNDVLTTNSTTHRFVMNMNNAGAIYPSGVTVAHTSGNCVEFAANGYDLIDAGGACGISGGGSAFNAITSGTNTTATMVVGAGGSLDYTSTGLIDASQLSGAAPPTSATLTGTNSSKQLAAATGHSVAAVLTCADSSGSGTAQSCSTSPTFTPAAGDSIIYTTTTANTGTGLTINVNSLGAKSVAKWQGTTTLAANDILAGKQVLMTYDGTNWEASTIGNAPSGSTTAVLTRANYRSAGRAASTIYQNTSASPLILFASMGGSSSTNCVTDSSATPSTVVFAHQTYSSGGNNPAICLVMPNNYYEITGNTSFSTWNEYTFGAGTFADSGNLSGSRTLGTAYHNTGSGGMFVEVYLSGGSSGNTITVTTDSASSPSTVISTHATQGTALGAFFAVPAGNYYKVTTSGSASISSWREITTSHTFTQSLEMTNQWLRTSSNANQNYSPTFFSLSDARLVTLWGTESGNGTGAFCAGPSSFGAQGCNSSILQGYQVESMSHTGATYTWEIMQLPGESIALQDGAISSSVSWYETTIQ